MSARTDIGILGVLLAAVAAIAFVGGAYWADIAILLLIYAGAATAWNIAGGYSGTSSFGHGLFFGAGAYTSTMLAKTLGLTPWVGLIVALLVGGALGAGVAWLGARYAIGGLSFAVLTLALAEIAFLFINSYEPFGASRGISIAPASNGAAGMQFPTTSGYVVTALGFFAVCAIVAIALSRGPEGYRFRAVRDNAPAAEAMGIEPVRVRMTALGASAALTAAGGVVYAQYLLFINPTLFGPAVTINVILFTLVGGIGTIWGPALGTLVLYPLGAWLRATFGGHFPGLDTLVFGALIVACVITFPTGLVGAAQRLGIPARFFHRSG